MKKQAGLKISATAQPCSPGAGLLDVYWMITEMNTGGRLDRIQLVFRAEVCLLFSNDNDVWTFIPRYLVDFEERAIYT